MRAKPPHPRRVFMQQRRKIKAGMANRNGAGRMTPQHLADKAVRTFGSRLRPCERLASRAGRPQAL